MERRMELMHGRHVLSLQVRLARMMREPRLTDTEIGARMPRPRRGIYGSYRYLGRPSVIRRDYDTST